MCTKAYFSKQSLVVHEKKVHLGIVTPRSHKCDVSGCTMAFTCAADLEYHIRTHTGLKPYQCPSCDKAYHTRSKLNWHKKNKHSGKPVEKNHVCPTCGAAFDCHARLKTHMRYHTGDLPFKCPECEKGFPDKGSLNHHIKTHKPLTDGPLCETCGQMCQNQADLKRHIRSSHTRERPFNCRICDKAFIESCVMHAHVREVHGEKAFKCPQCPATFDDFRVQRAHEQVHFVIPRRDLKCNRCDAQFKTQAGLKHHMWSHDGFPCLFCETKVQQELSTCDACRKLLIIKVMGIKERAVFSAIEAADPKFSEFTRDRRLGNGVALRPDAYTIISDNGFSVMFMVEVDEDQHAGYTVSSEITRLKRIHDFHESPLFVLRYNPDQPDGMTPEKLKVLIDRYTAVLGGEYILAAEAPSGIHVEYIGYTPERVELLNRAL